MKLNLPILNFPKQQTIFDSVARHRIVAKGRRFGLTRGAANDFIASALKGKFKRGLWVDTVNSNIDRYIERYFVPALKKLNQEMWEWRKQDKIVKIRGAYIDFRSSDRPENLEGFGYDKYFINEAGIVLKDQYLWHNAIRPMLWDYSASGVIGGTPKGKGVFEELFNRGVDTNQTDFGAFRFSTFDNPYLPASEIRDEMKSMPERVVRQEIYAEFLDDTGVVFRGVKAVANLLPEDPKSDHLYVIGCDLARVEDFTVIAVYDRSNNHQVFQMRFNQLEWPFVKERIKEVSFKYNHALVVLDATGVGDPIYMDLVRDRVPIEAFKFTNSSKKDIINKLANWIELKNINMLQLDETVQELTSFTYEISNRGNVIYEAPVGFHDDIVMAHALAVWSLQPISKEKKEENLSIIAKDIREKAETYNKSDEDAFLDYEAV